MNLPMPSARGTPLRAQVSSTLGMQPCEGTEAVPPNARSHTVLLAGLFVGHQQVSSSAGGMGSWAA